jgi:type II secretory ATPase GspE/PulE/Tfp pilus assembly ATPase PilB-like protein
MSAEQLTKTLEALEADDPNYALQFVECLLETAQQVAVSDVHLQPAANSLNVRWRVDGVLCEVGTFPQSTVSNVVARLKVLSGLLTYQMDVPQEGRIRDGESAVEMRVSTFPTLYGERAVVRLFARQERLTRLADLGMPDEIRDGLARLIGETTGMILVTGPAGSGKTTTLYACLRELVVASGGGRSIVSLEDPIESAIDGVAQAPIHAAGGFDFAVGLRSLMRQDPEVIMVGEIRDEQTAEVAFQAALTGQLVLSSFHAGSAAGAIARLADMGVAPYLLRSGILGIVCQRLVRRLCNCAVEASDAGDRLGLPVESARRAVGCEQCGGAGFSGRMLLAEMLSNRGDDVHRAIMDRREAQHLQQAAESSGMTPIWQRANHAVESGATSAEEIRRVLGFSDYQSANNSSEPQ